MEDDEIAAAMGFSAFGAAPRKRKYDNSGSPPRPTASSSSGANTTRLGARPKMEDGASGHAQDSSVEDRDSAVVESTETAPYPATNARGKLKQPAATGLAAFLALGSTLPDEQPPTAQQEPTTDAQANEPSPQVSFGGPPITQAELNRLRQGVKNDDGDPAYFLPSFVEDPWARLKQQQR